MRKKIISFALIFVSFFIFKNVKAAKTYCNYELTSENLTAKYTIMDGKIDRPHVSGSINGYDDVFNWDDSLEGTSFTGKNYFETQKKCPPYFYIIKRGAGAYRFYLSDEGSGSDFEKKLKNEYPGMQFYYILPLLGSEEQKKDEEEWENNLASSCMAFTDEQTCNQGYINKDDKIKFSCIWNVNEFSSKGYCNTDKLLYIRCGDAFDIPYQAPTIISFIVNFLKILTPILLIILSVISLLKALASSNEDEIKKTQKSLIKKIIAAVMVFFVVSIVQFVVMKFADSGETDDISSCLSCFLNNDCDNSLYYKTNIAGTYFCTDANGTKTCK